MPVAHESPLQPEALVDALDARQKPLDTAERHRGIDFEALARPEAMFAVARDDAGRAVGCGAIVLSPARGRRRVRPHGRQALRPVRRRCR